MPNALTEPPAYPAERATGCPFNPPPAYRAIQDDAPISRVSLWDSSTPWLVTRYADQRTLLGDPRLSADTTNPAYPIVSEASRARQQVAPLSFLVMDDPVHARLRRMVTAPFAVKRVEAMRPAIQQIVEAEDAPFFNQAADDALSDVRTGSEEALQRIEAGSKALRSYIERLIDERLELDVLPEDIIGQMVGAMKEGTVTRKEVVQSGASVTVAGHDTTASMVATGTLTLLQHPDQMERLRANPELIPAAIEELLRYLTIVNLVVARVALDDIEIGGVTIPAGEGIIPLNFSADRDDARFPDAATFDIDRDARGHVAFGYGVHQCLGQPLARVELRIIFETLLRRVPTLRLAVPVEDLKFKVNAPVHGVAELPVAW